MDYKRKITNMIEDEGLLNSSSISSSLDEQTSLDIDLGFNHRLNHQSFVLKPNFKNGKS